jgi:hypothetical protein
LFGHVPLFLQNSAYDINGKNYLQALPGSVLYPRYAFCHAISCQKKGGSVESVEQVRVRVLPDGRLTRSDAARYIGAAEKTLAMWQLQGKGPRSVKVGGRVFYYRDDLDRFIRGETA